MGRSKNNRARTNQFLRSNFQSMPISTSRYYGMSIPSIIKDGREQNEQSTLQDLKSIIIRWLDTNLSNVVKNGIGFYKATVRDSFEYCFYLNRDIHTDSNRIFQYLHVSFKQDHIICVGPQIYTKIEYANPDMLEILKMCLIRYYNGV